MRGMVYTIDDSEMENIMLSGGKGCNLCKLIRAGFRVPEGFIVTTEAFYTYIDPVQKQAADDKKQAVQKMPFPKQLEQELMLALGEGICNKKYAVRSSATAEDLEDASFAGQQDSYLNVSGIENIKQAVLNCFASLYNERAIAYREDVEYQEEAAMAVIVQEMVPAEKSGVLFTADPFTSDRFTAVLEAVDGLGDELVSGLKIPCTWKIRNGSIAYDDKIEPVLTEAEVLDIVSEGERIQKQMGSPQDIEWCYADGSLYIVQARNITTLYPLPESKDGLKRLYLSAGHMQMMTDIVLPLGISFMKMIALFEMIEDGGRLYIDITHDLKSFSGRKMLRQKVSAMDPFMYQGVTEILEQKDYLKTIPKGPGSFSTFSGIGNMLKEGIRIYRRNDQADIEAYVERQQQSLADLKNRLKPLSGVAAIRCIQDDQAQLASIVYDATGYGMILASQYAIMKIDRIGKELTGRENLSNDISKSVDHNITSQMGLELSALSDQIRNQPEIIRYLEEYKDSFTIEGLRQCPGGEEIAGKFWDFLTKYGMRAAGEIDISKPRFREKPSELIASILTNINTLPRGYGKQLFEQGKKESEELISDMLRLAKEKRGERYAKKLARYISFFRSFVGTREYPKYFWIGRYDIYKQAIMREADALCEKGVLSEPEDFFYLYLDELMEAVQKQKADKAMICSRREAYKKYAVLTPPRLIFSDGEVPEMKQKSDIPKGALGGLGVSAGVVEGRARVVNRMEDAVMEQGDILVTTFTDPSWTPVFVSIAGLVTEVGGMMTHGAVITREYRLPAVVGVSGATRMIKNGDWIRLNGDQGYVEIIRNHQQTLAEGVTSLL